MKFKVGDRVVGISNGEVLVMGNITNINNLHCWPYEVVDDRGEHGLYLEEELVLISEGTMGITKAREYNDSGDIRKSSPSPAAPEPMSLDRIFKDLGEIRERLYTLARKHADTWGHPTSGNTCVDLPSGGIMSEIALEIHMIFGAVHELENLTDKYRE